MPHNQMNVSLETAPAESTALLLAIDVDALSHRGLSDRLTTRQMAIALGLAETYADCRGPVKRVRYACSTKTSDCHAPLVWSARPNTWAARRGIDGADAVIRDELHGWVAAQQHGKGRGVVLVANDHAYAGPVAALTQAGIPVWLIAPRANRPTLSAALASVSTTVTYLELGEDFQRLVSEM